MKLDQPVWLTSVVSALLLGAELGCNRTDTDPATTAPSSKSAALASAAPTDSASSMAAHDPQSARDCCMGLNECKGKGGCAVPESHSCRGQNECRGKGGCNAHCPK